MLSEQSLQHVPGSAEIPSKKRTPPFRIFREGGGKKTFRSNQKHFSTCTGPENLTQVIRTGGPTMSLLPSLSKFDAELYKPRTARCDNAPGYGKKGVLSERDGLRKLRKKRVGDRILEGYWWVWMHEKNQPRTANHRFALRLGSSTLA